MQYEEVIIIDWLLLVGKYMYVYTLSVEKVSHFTVSEKRELLQKVMNQYFRKFSLSLVVLYIKSYGPFVFLTPKLKLIIFIVTKVARCLFLQNVMNPYILRMSNLFQCHLNDLVDIFWCNFPSLV